jgi:hypothetical protein
MLAMARAEISAFLTSCSYGEKCVGALTLALTLRHSLPGFMRPFRNLHRQEENATYAGLELRIRFYQIGYKR